MKVRAMRLFDIMRPWDYETLRYDSDMMSGAGLRPAIGGVREYHMVRRWDFDIMRLDDHMIRRR